MAQTDVKTILGQIKKGELSNIYYLYGGNISGVESLTKAIIKKAVGDNIDYALTKLSGESLDIPALRDLLEMMPMMSDYNCILINDYNCEAQREDTTKQLIEALKEVSPQTVVIFNITGFEIKIKVNSKGRFITDKNKKLADFIVKNGVVCEQPLKTPAELAKEISAKVSSRGGAISVADAQELAQMCLSDPLMINNEVDKLCAYAGGREITRELINLLVPRQSDVTVYNLAKAVVSFNKKEAFSELYDLLERFPKPDDRRYLLSVISGTFIDLYRAACARGSGVSTAQMMSDFGYKYDFVVKNAYRDSAKMSIKRLRECVRILCETAVTLNSTSADEKIVLEKAVAQMLVTRN